jgi:hypothetical protein
MIFGGKKLGKREKMMLPFIGVGFELFFLIIGAFYVGGFLDKKFSLGGMGTVLMVIIVFASWIFHLTVLMKRVKENLEIDESSDSH